MVVLLFVLYYTVAKGMAAATKMVRTHFKPIFNLFATTPSSLFDSYCSIHKE